MTDMAAADANTSGSKIPLNSSFSTLQEPHDAPKIQENQSSQSITDAVAQTSSDKVQTKEST